MEEKVLEVLAGVCGVESEELEQDLQLFEEGLLDSFGVIQLVVALEEAFGLALEIENIPREKIETPAAILHLIREASQ